MKDYKFLLFAFVLLLFATPVFATFDFDDDLPDKENSTQVVLVFGREKDKTQIKNESVTDIFDLSKCDFYSHDLQVNRYDTKTYTDAVDLGSQYHLTNPTKVITVKDMARIKNPFRFSTQSNRKFIANSFYTDSKDKA